MTKGYSEATISVDQLEQAFEDLTDDFIAEKQDALEQLVRDVAEWGKTELRAKSPKRRSKGRHYASGWRVYFEEGIVSIVAEIGNDLKPGLTHLLEKGHVNKYGGRAPAIPHIDPVYRSILEHIDAGLS